MPQNVVLSKFKAQGKGYGWYELLVWFEWLKTQLIFCQRAPLKLDIFQYAHLHFQQIEGK